MPARQRLRGALLAHVLALAGASGLRAERNAARYFTYDYLNHGTDWKMGTCISRARQSPIDLPATAPQPSGNFSYAYMPITEPFDFLNNGHAFSADVALGGYGGISYNNVWYALLNVNLHVESEHTFGGMKKPAELHLVHKRYDAEGLLILSVPVQDDSVVPSPSPAPAPAAAGPYEAPPSAEGGFNPTVQAFLREEPPLFNTRVKAPADEAEPFDLNPLVQGGGAYFEYLGSLTAPPCAETATWLVASLPAVASATQVRKLREMIYSLSQMGNDRATMPLNGRGIGMLSGVYDPLLIAGQGGNGRDGASNYQWESDREYVAKTSARQAMRIARATINRVQQLDVNLRKAAKARAESLVPALEEHVPN